MKNVGGFILVATLSLGFSGCATQQSLSDQAMFQQYPAVAELSRKLEEGRNQNLEILSPEQFKQSAEAYAESVELARTDNQKANTIADEALTALNKANANAHSARDVLEDVLKARDKARAANAQMLNVEAYASAEKEFLELTRAIEQGKLEKAKAGRADVIRAYSKTELTALKDSTVQQALDAITRAKKNNIDDIAPKTFQLATEEYNLALKTLDANRMDTEKAAIHAKKSLWHVQHATQIAEVIAHFDASDYDAEDQVLWYQNQIARIVSPVAQQVPFNQSNKQVVKGLNSQISGLVNDKNAAQIALNDAKAMQAKIEQDKAQELQSIKALTEAEKRRQKALVAKFSFIQALYKANEAEVYRQMDNVLIRAHGFAFPSGQSEIDAKNFALMNKIIESLAQFPNAKIVVSGHTDNRGNEELNRNLSQERAMKVAEFLTQVGKISADRVEAIGYGKSRPVANNDSEEGRASNRRVEILIVNS